MKKLTYILLALCFACSSSDDGDSNNGGNGGGDDDQGMSTFAAVVTQDATTVSIDEIVTLEAIANEIINEISVSWDGGATFPLGYSIDFGNTANLFLDFESVGTKNIVFRLENDNGDVFDNPVTIDVVRGNAVKIEALQLNSFNNINETWDDEFPNTDPNHLADVFFFTIKT